MRKLYFLSLIVCLFFLQTGKTYAQNVGIGTTTPRPFALLEIKSQNSGLLVPRVDISDPVFLGLGALDHGLIVFDTLLNQLQVWNGAAWQTAASAWSLNGSDIFYNTGNVGIGTNTPSQALDLAGGNINIDLTHAYLQGGTHLLSFSPLNNNIRIGANAAPSITTGTEIIAIGNNAGLSLQDGGSNIAIGEEALRNTVSGAGNIGIGRLAMIFNNGGSGNVALGPEALHNNSSGNNNVGVGADANYSNSTGDFNTAVGGGAGVLSPNLDNSTAIGGLAKVNSSNSMVLGMINGVGGGFADVSVGIGTPTPNQNASLDLGHDDRGLQFNRVDRSNLTLAAIDRGMVVYDSTTNELFVWDGSAWVSATSGSAPTLQSAYDGGQTISMGSGNIDFISSSANSVLFIDELNERLGIGTSTPSAGFKLDVVGGDIQVNGLRMGRGTGGILNNLAIGQFTLNNNPTGGLNLAIGNTALQQTSSGGSNLAIGTGALIFNTTGSSNTIIGHDAMRAPAGSNQNTGIGEGIMRNGATGDANTAIGYYSLRNKTGNLNSALGISSGITLTAGNNNTFLGANADAGIATLNNATAIGANAIVSQDNSVVLGNNANVGIGTSTPNEKLEVVGGDALINSVTVGRGSGNDISNTAFGNQALAANLAAGLANTAIGQSALSSNTTGTSSTALGFYALRLNTTGYSNVAVGHGALDNNSIGFENTAVGQGALQANTTGGRNTSIGRGTLTNNTTGSYNIAMGWEALVGHLSGNYNTAIGNDVLRNNASGSNNTGVGSFAVQGTTGDNNTGFGNSALRTNTTGSDNTAIGFSADVASGALTNATAIGANSIVDASNKMVLGAVGTSIQFDGELLPAGAAGSAGQVLTSAGPGATPTWAAAGGGWGLTGNAGTSGANFIGTTDGQNLAFRTNNFTRMTINTAGAVGINSLPTGTSYLTVGNATLAQAIQGTNSRATASSNTGIRGDASGSTAANYGLYGNAFGAGSTARGVYGAAGTAATAIGVEGAVAGAGTTTAYGVRGLATSTGTDNYGIYGQASGGTNNYAGFFQGDMITTGNIGAGNSSPNAPLQFATANANRKIVLFEGVNDDHQFFGFGTNPASLRYQINQSFSSHIFYAGINSTTSNELMRIQGNGNVGIGVSAPTEKLQISSSAISTSVIITNDAVGVANTDGLLIGENNAGVGIINNRENERLILGTNGIIGQIVLDPSGNVGIGVPVPSYALDVGGPVRSGRNSVDGQLRIFSEQGVTDYEVIFNPNPAMTATTTYTLPADDGAASDVLTTDGNGLLSWGSASGIVADNGLTLTGTDLDLGGAMNQNTTIDRNDYGFALGTNNTITGPQNGELILGYDNTVSGFGGIAIGTGNTVSGNRGTALGNYVEANHLGSFVIGDWSGSAPGLTASSTSDQFTARFNAGYRFYATSDPIANPNTGLFINNAGNVGIGTNNPGANRLQVQTQATSASAGYFENNITGGISGNALTVVNSGTRSIGHNGMLVQNLVTKVGGSNSTKIGLKIESTGAWGVATVNQPNIGLDVTVSGADNNYAAIFNGGNVGIGVSNPGDPLQVSGTIRATTLIAQSLAGFGVNPIASRRLYSDAGSTDIAIYGAQTDFTAGNYAIFGEGRNGGTTAWLNVSDRRLKKNITPLNNALENVLKLRGVNFDWRNEEFPDKGLAKGHDIGLIAQEVKAIYPEFVNHAPDGFYGVSYAGLVPVLIEAIKEQQSLIESQRTQIESLQAFNKEERVNDLKTQEQINSLQAQIDRLNAILTSEARK